MFNLACLIGWHTWIYSASGTKRTCNGCGKTQHTITNGKDQRWED